MSLRVACLQLDPILKQPAKNIKRADELLESVERGSIDFLVLPEMAFTGYCFTSREDIAPYVEEVPAGKTTKWAMRTARKLGCYVQVGVPTLQPLTSFVPGSPSSSAPTPDDMYYNSVVLISPDGKLVTTYHKHFLFETDKSWATPGKRFVSLDLPFPPSSSSSSLNEAPSNPSRTFKYAPAICMDLNAEAFDASLERLAFSHFATDEHVDLVCASNAWLDSDVARPPDDGAEAEDVREGIEDRERAHDEAGNAWDDVRGLVGYWVYRMSTNLDDPGPAFVVANRIGKEGESIFAGSSCIVELGQRPTVIKHASKKKEELIVAEVRLARNGSR
ncbi:hypothetical protein JCM10212_002679 [Sporobolomyces blumeae]